MKRTQRGLGFEDRGLRDLDCYYGSDRPGIPTSTRRISVAFTLRRMTLRPTGGSAFDELCSDYTVSFRPVLHA